MKTTNKASASTLSSVKLARRLVTLATARMAPYSRCSLVQSRRYSLGALSRLSPVVALMK
eukprot:scaffold48_cov311-Pinguiococcus_pyrenoidosus.AAC.220